MSLQHLQGQEGCLLDNSEWDMIITNKVQEIGSVLICILLVEEREAIIGRLYISAWELTICYCVSHFRPQSSGLSFGNLAQSQGFGDLAQQGLGSGTSGFGTPSMGIGATSA